MNWFVFLIISKNNGFATDWFKPSRGVRQGCPLSPYLVSLTAERLSNKIRQKSIIKGIRIFGSEIKLSQFADDTKLFCADVASAEQTLQTINTFGNFSGLVLNVEKTKAFWLGMWLNNRTKPLGMKWMNTATLLNQGQKTETEHASGFHSRETLYLSECSHANLFSHFQFL